MIRRGVLAASIVLLAAVAAPTAALEGEGLTITVAREARVQRAYEPIPNDDPVTTTVFLPDPETCREVTSCVLVPMTVRLPDDRPDEQFVLYMTLDWESRPAPGDAQQGNDLDLYVFEAQPNEDGTYNEVARAATADEDPEVAKLDTPEKVDYLLAVWNFHGDNEGFSLDLRIEGATNPPESAANAAPPTPTTSPGAAAPTPTTPAPAVAPAPPGGTAAAPVLPAPADVDDFGEGFDESISDFEHDIRADAGIDLLARGRRQVGPPGEVSTATALLWLFVVPLVLTAAVAGVLLRRRSSLWLR